MYYVYVLKSDTNGRHYIGVTTGVERRLCEHNRGKDKSIRGRGPFKILFTEMFESRSQAMQRERQLKNYKGGQAFRKLVSERMAGKTHRLKTIASPSSNG